MLSDREQRRLTQIESQLKADDPAFVQRFDDRGRRRVRLGRRDRVALVAVVAAVTVVGIALFVGSVVIAVVALTAIGAIVGLWLTNRQRR